MSSINESSRLTVDSIAPDFLVEQAAGILSEYNLPFEGSRLSWAYEIAKRGLDICGALVGLAVLVLLIPIIALLILWEDRGPIFYRHTRIGQHGTPFFIYKLRSMRVDADDYLKRHPDLQKEWQQSGKLLNDPRVTRIGHFLRRSSLDELPQLLNVLRGEMSLVGPRAIQSSEAARFGELYDLRQTVKPGLTGLWQVSGRSITDYEQRCVLDCTYAIDRSFWMDLHILMKTFPVVLRGVGAY